jgi:hypothetical protein
MSGEPVDMALLLLGRVKQLFGRQHLGNQCLDAFRQDFVPDPGRDVPVVSDLAINLAALLAHDRLVADVCAEAINIWWDRSQRELGHFKIYCFRSRQEQIRNRETFQDPPTALGRMFVRGHLRTAAAAADTLSDDLLRIVERFEDSRSG